jgi:hypothetical protein
MGPKQAYSLAPHMPHSTLANKEGVGKGRVDVIGPMGPTDGFE